MNIDSAEASVIARSEDGVRVHAMTGNWRVIVAKRGERHASWYFNVLDDPRIAEALMLDAYRRLSIWETEK